MDENHTLWLYKNKNKGMSRRLRGNVLVELVFVADRQTIWLQDEMDQFYFVYKDALEGIRKQAAAAGVALSFSTVVGRLSYDRPIDLTNVAVGETNRICDLYLRNQGFQSCLDYTQSRKRTNDADEVALIFVMERGFRAFAYPGDNLEYCALCQDDNAHAIAHELLHLFGAVDLYYPYHVYGQTMAYFPETIMCTYEGMEVDPLTQYLIGWKAEPTPKVKEFMSKVQDCTLARYAHANMLEVCRNREAYLLQNATAYPSVHSIRQRCLECDPWAEYLLGLCYREGIEVEKDPAKAEEYFSRSGRTSLTIGAYAHAQMLLCRGIRTAQDRENLWLLLVYNSFDHLKLSTLRTACLLTGVGGRKGPQEAVLDAIKQYQNEDWYLKQAKRSAKLYQIAEKLSSGIPALHAAVKKLRIDYDRMLDSGDPDLHYLIARILEEGEHAQKDLSGAFSLYKMAAQGGNELACRELARCCRNGIGTGRDMNAARQWEAQAAICRAENPWDAFCHLLRNRW